jgi:catechol 2,3-dioxygenase-like lactoylglutathione lyase family enzyme
MTTENVFALGKLIRFAPWAAMDADFYGKVLNLPLIRTVHTHVQIFWAGEATVYELLYVKDKQEQPPADLAGAGCVPVFRVTGLEAILATLAGQGVEIVCVQQGERGREAFFRDNSGFIVGLRERSEASTLPQDLAARRRRLRGETYNPGCKSMPEGRQELGWIVRHVADMAGMTKFFRDVIGLAQVGEEQGRPLFDLGDNTLLELAPGGRAHPVPTDRSQGPSGAVLRVHDVGKIRAALPGSGGHVVNDVIAGLHWAELMYFADPEGVVFGAEQGFHPGTYAPGKFVLPENLEAARREKERLAAVALG